MPGITVERRACVSAERLERTGEVRTGFRARKGALLELAQSAGLAALAFQISGTSLIALLSYFLTRTVRRQVMNCWTAAWFCLFTALIADFLAIEFPGWPVGGILQGVYFFGQYAFGLLLIAGCRFGTRGTRPTVTALLLLGVSGAALAASLVLGVGDPGQRFAWHALVMAGLFAIAFYVLNSSLTRGDESPGVQIVSVALGLLALDFAHHLPLTVYARAYGLSLPPQYFALSTYVDALLLVLLGFGTIVMILDDVRRELREANVRLIGARDRMELLARTDQLTGALNRHAFSLVVPGQGMAASGCIAIVDVNDLKRVNDVAGHAAGDEAIRAVVLALKSIARGGDLIFRWGGDEFVVLFEGMSLAVGAERLARLDDAVAAQAGQLDLAGVTLSAAWGVAPFGPQTSLEQALKRADDMMYEYKERQKGGGRR